MGFVHLQMNKWGMFSYKLMLFGHVKVGATFQNTIDIAFCKLIRQSIVVYLNYVTVFSRSSEDHIRHLKNFFEQCRRYKSSLNPGKSVFIVSEGNLLRHIVSKRGIKVHLDRVQTITQISHPSNKKSMQSFLGKIKFLL